MHPHLLECDELVSAKGLDASGQQPGSHLKIPTTDGVEGLVDLEPVPFVPVPSFLRSIITVRNDGGGTLSEEDEGTSLSKLR